MRARHPYIFSCVVSFLLIAFFFPTVLTMQQTPMGAKTWELQDPLVSYMNFTSGLSTLRYEVFENGNLLWSNLRGLGMPLLGNEIQVAPLFPLTWLLLPIPEEYYWNVFIFFRLLLLGSVVFLIARKMMQMTEKASLFFVFNFVYGLYVLRWISHPWSNGLLAGMFYIFCLDRSLQASQTPFGKKRFMWISLMALAVYSLVTCGFPEASILCALMTILIHGPQLIHALLSKKVRLGRYSFDIGTAHFIGFACSLPQTLALLEFVTTISDFRETHGTIQFPSFEIVLSSLTRFNMETPSFHPPPHYFGLIPLFFFFIGLFQSLWKIRRISLWEVIAWILIGFYIVKLFPVWPEFNHILGSIPGFKESLFTVYFLPVFLWPFAFFCAKGVEFSFGKDLPLAPHRKGLLLLFLSLIVTGMVALLVHAAWKTQSLSYLDILLYNSPMLQVFVLFLFCVTLMMYYFSASFRNRVRWYNLIFYACFFSMALEFNIIRPSTFFSIDEFYEVIAGPEPEVPQIKQFAQANQLPFHEVRVLESNGRNVSEGLATPDNGAPAIVQERLSLLRTSLFETSWDGFLPIQSQKFPYSLNFISTPVYEKSFLHADRSLERTEEIVSRGSESSIVFDHQTLPRAFIPEACISVESMEETAEIVTRPSQFQLGAAYVESLDNQERQFCETFQASLSQVAIVKDHGSSLHLSKVRGPSIVVLHDNYFPGWTAYDQKTGKTIEIKPANISFRALILPENRDYEIVFQYRPFWLPISMALILISLFYWLFLGGYAWRKRKN